VVCDGRESESFYSGCIYSIGGLIVGLENADVYIARRTYENTKKKTRNTSIHALGVTWGCRRRIHIRWAERGGKMACAEIEIVFAERATTMPFDTDAGQHDDAWNNTRDNE